jgi:hypothetical protein
LPYLRGETNALGTWLYTLIKNIQTIVNGYEISLCHYEVPRLRTEAKNQLCSALSKEYVETNCISRKAPPQYAQFLN